MAYSTIGILDVPRSHGSNAIILGYKDGDNSDRQVHEIWGIQGEDTRSPSQVDYGNGLALAEAIGCLCHGLVLNLPKSMIAETTVFSPVDAQQLDDVLLCVANGILRRMKGSEHMTIQVSVTFDGDNRMSDSLTTNAKNYVQGYLERAMCRLWELQSATAGASEGNGSILEQCKIRVGFSTDSMVETATQMASSYLVQGAAVGDHNVVSRPLFGALCNQVQAEIRSGWLSHGYRSEIEPRWKKLSSGEGVDESRRIPQQSVEQAVSTEIKDKVEALLSTVIADAQERLDEMENEMDEAILEGIEDGVDSVGPMPGFKQDADSILSAVSSQFLQLMDDDTLSASDREWVNSQRIQALKNVAGTGIRRLFHLHLQNLRDHYGQWYESMLEGSITDGFDDEDNREHAWKLRSQKAARQAEEGFRLAAFGSVPQMCQHPDGELRDELAGMFSCVEALGGLLEDMFEVTSARGMEEEEWAEIMGGVTDGSAGEDVATAKPRVGLRQVIKNLKAKIQKRGPAKWYERLALKALVIGVNYVQGWIVLQALRREAMKRDRDMPKFPLF
ncbi:hypothetical protein ACHAXT_000812 [Thalassiosira profunda]